MSIPTGPIKTTSPLGGNFGIEWSAITRYDHDIHRAADPVSWPADRVRGHIVIESQGDPRATQVNPRNGDSFGLFQVVPYGVGWEGWHRLVKEKAGLSANASRQRVIDALYDPAINTAVGVAILEAFYQQHGKLDKASSAFFTGNPDWKGSDSMNGTTARQYRDSLNALIAEQEAFAPPDILRIVFGGPYRISQEWAVTSSAADYGYGRGHGLNGSQHTGIDAVGDLRDPLFTPFDGTVTCAATNAGGGSWGTGCAAFNDYSDGGGAGRVEILHTDGKRSLIFGHCDTSTVRAGDRVRAGQQVGTVGSMNAPHVHLEAREYVGGSALYMIRDPRVLFSDVVGITPIPQYAPRLPVPQPEDFATFWRVEVVTAGVKLLQSTAPDSPEVAPPFSQGEQFKAVYIVIGQDGTPFWVSTLGSRIPLAGTRLLGAPIFGPVGSVDTAKVLDSLRGLHGALEATVRVVDETVTELEGAA
jgi:murein DD-endopeptidase MepM/ murein hydrolase activator NlpD